MKKCILIFYFIIMVGGAFGQASFKNEIGINILSLEPTWKCNSVFNACLNDNWFRGLTYKRFVTSRVAIRAAIQYDQGAFEYGSGENDGIYREGDYKTFKSRLGGEYGYTIKKWKPYIALDLSYTRHWEESISSGGMVGGTWGYQDLTNKIAVSPGLGLNYRISNRLGVNLESSFHWKIWDKGVRTNKFVSHHALASDEPYVEHFIFSPLSTFSFNYSF